ncbi:MAG: hypothetical protein IT324_25845 [Anaerolineae bacterium]|nr:hypothetical protein [Anaerolineae bacterium]
MRRRSNRLLKYLAGLLVITLLLSYLAVVYGRVHTWLDAALEVGLGWCEGTPCYQNLVPGQTSWSKELIARNMLQTQPDAAYRPVLFPSFDREMLETIFLPLPADTSLTAGDIVQLYGIPCHVDIDFYGKSAQFTLAYPRLRAQLDTEVERLHTDTRVHYLFLSSPTSYSPGLTSDPCAPHVISSTVARTPTVRRPWHGFTTLYYYLTTP